MSTTMGRPNDNDDTLSGVTQENDAYHEVKAVIAQLEEDARAKAQAGAVEPALKTCNYCGGQVVHLYRTRMQGDVCDTCWWNYCED